jgi:hypothetical protein
VHFTNVRFTFANSVKLLLFAYLNLPSIPTRSLTGVFFFNFQDRSAPSFTKKKFLKSSGSLQICISCYSFSMAAKCHSFRTTGFHLYISDFGLQGCCFLWVSFTMHTKTVALCCHRKTMAEDVNLLFAINLFAICIMRFYSF